MTEVILATKKELAEKDALIRAYLAIAPQAPVSAVPVAFGDLGHLARKEDAGSSVYPYPLGTCRAPLYASPPPPAQADDAHALIRELVAALEAIRAEYGFDCVARRLSDAAITKAKAAGYEP